MATKKDSDRMKCVFQWQIENASYCLMLKNRKFLRSQTFILDGPERTKWYLELDSILASDDVTVYLYREEDCIGPHCVDVEYNLAILGKNGLVLVEETDTAGFDKGDYSSCAPCLGSVETVFIEENEIFLPGDTLTVLCTLWSATKDKSKDGEVKSKHLYGRTVLNRTRKSFHWPIEKCSTLRPGVVKKFKDDLMEFRLILNEDSIKNLRINIIILHDFIKYFWCGTTIADSEGKKESCGTFVHDDFKNEKSISSMLIFPTKFAEEKNRYLPNDKLSLYFDIVCILTVEQSDDSMKYSVMEEEEKCESLAVLIQDWKSMYNDRIFSDIELRTSTKTFPAHKNILSARSPVFKKMFSHDLKEKTSGHVDIIDLEDDIIHQLLLFIYTGFLQDLHFESATKLYTAADKYEIMSLKNICSSFLRDNLSPTTACDVLLFADLHKDVDLKEATQVYIVENDEIFRSPALKDLMCSNIHLAAEIMYRKLNPGKI